MKKEPKDTESELKGATCVILSPADRESYSPMDQLRALMPKRLSPKSKEILAEYHRKYEERSKGGKPQ